MGEALGLATQICEALNAAHEKGFVHRDLKPGNVKVTPNGKVKLLDFGLVRILEAGRLDPDLSNSATTITQSVRGAILGTPAYMSPEQARGEGAGRQSDIWAFGCVLYEMLTGRPAFTGGTTTEVLGRIVTSDPDFSCLPETTPTIVRSLLRRTLHKDRERRLHDAADARIEIQEVLTGSIDTTEVAPVQATRYVNRLAWISVVLVIAALSIVAVLNFRRELPDPVEMHLQIGTPPGDDLTAFALSPDGRKVVFQATRDGKSQLWLRPLDSETLEPIPGTETI